MKNEVRLLKIRRKDKEKSMTIFVIQLKRKKMKLNEDENNLKGFICEITITTFAIYSYVHYYFLPCSDVGFLMGVHQSLTYNIKKKVAGKYYKNDKFI